MDEHIVKARQEAMRQALRQRLATRLRQSGRVDFGFISRTVIRDPAAREWAIKSLVESGEATIEVVFETGGRPRTVLVLKE